MAHMVETMAYAAVNGAPWHRLGVPVSADLTPAEILTAAHLDWTVAKQPVYNLWDGAYVTVDGKFNLARTTDGKVLDVVGSRYNPTQNAEAVEFFTEFVTAGDMRMDTCGSLEGGRRTWALASIEDGFTLAGGDRVNGYLLLSSPHREGESFQVKFTGVRVVCNNTITAALNGGGATWRMSHAKRFDADMQQQAKTALGLAKTRLNEFHEKAEFLATTRVNGSQALIEYVAVLSGSEVLDAIVDEASATDAVSAGGSVLDAILAGHSATAVTRAIRETYLNRAGRMILESILDSPGSDLPSAKGTWWGAVNGVTYAVDHTIGRSDDTRLTSAWFGPRSGLKTQAVELAVAYAQGKAQGVN